MGDCGCGSGQGGDGGSRGSSKRISRAELFQGAATGAVIATGLGTIGASPAGARTLKEGGALPRRRKGGRPLVIESIGARAFGGGTVPMPTDPTDFQACGHGFVEWFIPPRAHTHPMVLVHGSSTRGYQTTFDGQPGFQSIFLGENYPVYLVDLPWTGRAGKACQEYTWDPVSANFSARFVFTNRVGLWPDNTPESQKQFFPGVAFSHDPAVLDQYFRNQYVEFNTPENVEIQSDALAVLLEEVSEEHDKGAILHTHSSSANRGLTAVLKTDKIGAQIYWEPSAPPFFADGELPPPIPRADGQLIPAGTTIPLDQFMRFTKFPIVMIWGDNIPATLDPINTGTRLVLDSRRILVEQYRLFADAINKHGGNATVVHLPEEGVSGNTHYAYADTNINEVAPVVFRWLRREGLES